jgi:adenine-specific DNA-methyltransferase
LHAAAANDKQAIILDFFGGSGTTAHAVIELNKDGGDRKFIICEQMDYVETVTAARVRAVLKAEKHGEFIFCELLKYNEAFMERIQAAKTSKELVRIWEEIAEGSFLNWYVKPGKMPEEAVQEFVAVGEAEDGLKKQKRLLVELLDKNQLYVNLSEIDDKQFKVSPEDKALNKAFYGEAYNA